MLKKFLIALAAALVLTACAARLSSHPVTPADIGAPVSTAQMLEALKRPGSIAFEQVIAADWSWSEEFATPGVDPPDWTSAPLIG